METLTFRQFQRAMLPTLVAFRDQKKDLNDLAREIKSRPRPLTPPELLLLLAHECSIVYSRREKKYV